MGAGFVMYDRPVTAVDRLYAEASQLTREEQEELVARLVQARAKAESGAIDPGFDPDLDAELDEIEARIARGEMKTYSLAEVRQAMRERLDGLRRSVQ